MSILPYFFKSFLCNFILKSLISLCLLGCILQRLKIGLDFNLFPLLSDSHFFIFFCLPLSLNISQISQPLLFVISPLSGFLFNLSLLLLLKRSDFLLLCMMLFKGISFLLLLHHFLLPRLLCSRCSIILLLLLLQLQVFLSVSQFLFLKHLQSLFIFLMFF